MECPKKTTKKNKITQIQICHKRVNLFFSHPVEERSDEDGPAPAAERPPEVLILDNDFYKELFKSQQ